MEGGVAVAEDPPVGADLPVAPVARGGRHAHHGRVDRLPAPRAVEVRAAVVEDAAVGGHRVVALGRGVGVVQAELVARGVLEVADGLAGAPRAAVHVVEEGDCLGTRAGVGRHGRDDIAPRAPRRRVDEGDVVARVRVVAVVAARPCTRSRTGMRSDSSSASMLAPVAASAGCGPSVAVIVAPFDRVDQRAGDVVRLVVVVADRVADAVEGARHVVEAGVLVRTRSRHWRAREPSPCSTTRRRTARATRGQCPTSPRPDRPPRRSPRSTRSTSSSLYSFAPVSEPGGKAGASTVQAVPVGWKTRACSSSLALT